MSHPEPKNFGGRRRAGVDYSNSLRDMLPGLIGPGQKPKSKREIAAATGRNFETVTRLFERIRSDVHVADWRRGRTGAPTALWLLGPGDDVPIPPPMTSAEKSRRYRANPIGKATARAASDKWKKSEQGRAYEKAYNKVRLAKYHAKQEAKRTAYRALRQADPLMAAIMGARTRS